jgi:hypothetical protein
MKRINSLLLIWAALGMLSVPSFAKQMLTADTVSEVTVLYNYMSEPPLFPVTHNKKDCEDNGGQWYCAPGIPPGPSCCWY